MITAHQIAWIGRFAAPVSAIVVYSALPSGPDVGLPEEARRVAAMGVLMALLWMTEALPLPVTSLLPIVLLPLLSVSSISKATAPFADPFIFLFMGGFILALAMEKWGLHRRIALIVLRVVGGTPARLVAGFMLATALLSMWVSNTATTVMMLPIGVSVINLVRTSLKESEGVLSGDGVDDSDSPAIRNFATCLLLSIAYSASVGGMGTIIGTPPNTILAGFLHTQYGMELSFGTWMLFATPVVVVFLFIMWFLLTRILFPIQSGALPGGRQMIRDELMTLGKTSTPEWIVFAVFMTTATVWIARGPLTNWPWLVDHMPFISNLSDPGIAMAAAILLFMLPADRRGRAFVMDWRTAERLPWGVLLLFGGGLSLASAVKSTGLDGWIGQQVAIIGGAPIIILVLGVTALIVFLTEVTSNTATATAFLPILAGVATGIGAEPMLLLVPASMAASCAFMMPVATPPNAIVFGSGRVTIGQMVRAGFVLNFVSIALITLAVLTLGRILLTTAP